MTCSACGVVVPFLEQWSKPLGAGAVVALIGKRAARTPLGLALLGGAAVLTTALVRQLTNPYCGRCSTHRA